MYFKEVLDKIRHPESEQNTEMSGTESTFEFLKCSIINIDNSSEDACIQSGRLCDDSKEEFEDEHSQCGE